MVFTEIFATFFLGGFKLEELKSSQSMTQVDLPFLVQLSKQLYELNFKLHIL